MRARRNFALALSAALKEQECVAGIGYTRRFPFDPRFRDSACALLHGKYRQTYGTAGISALASGLECRAR